MSQPASPQVGVTVIDVSRSIFILVMVLVALGGAVLAMTVFTGGEELACTRSTSECTLTSWRFAHVGVTREALGMAHLQKAELASSKGSKGSTTYGLALVIDGEERVLERSSSNTSVTGRQQWIDSVNTFLKGSAPTLDVTYDEETRAVVMLVVLAFALGLFFLFRLRIIIDEGAGVVRVAKTVISGEGKGYLLDSLSGAFVRGSDKNTTIALRFAEGTFVDLTAKSNVGLDQKTRIAATIDQAIRTAKAAVAVAELRAKEGDDDDPI